MYTIFYREQILDLCLHRPHSRK